MDCAAGTIAKTMSAYDKKVSDAIYGTSERTVSIGRLEAMLDHEYDLNLERLDRERGTETAFFAFADTVTAQNYQGDADCHGWMGIRFQMHPRVDRERVVSLLEIGLSELRATGGEGDEDFLDRIRALTAGNQSVLVSDYPGSFLVAEHLARYSATQIALPIGVPNFLELPASVATLVRYLIQQGYVEPLEGVSDERLCIRSDDVLAMLRRDEPGWEACVPAEVAEAIRSQGLFGYAKRDAGRGD